ncbi:WD repeat-containing protein 44 [Zea mays]|uniref:KRN2 n=1 Tax=Zea mays TaxID=4577 RepID=A0A1D6E2N4_MAIZE|nr:WD repeat-containing protein 44 [Zea mays]XP_020403772.1 WD repeat-containing protein 44 [Zea mays]ONM14875.1 Transducin/WD40 repeat-like superfamily protein [Zea mays]ONM14876.1 Transducin/WD40 repeat-like superfamily protein [Zea mays]UNJ21494.1 KRN2 [Zea mays]UNJ21495.1 KRN2 [Zea mays]UNY85531.1 WD40-containting protein [Zea mays]|eukprot:XP_008669015.1 WD repeat-containing protein 44 [Zea mays]
MEGCQLLVGCRMEMEEEAFFDSREELTASPAPSPGPALPWSGSLDSVCQRRERFMRSMGLECCPAPLQADAVATVGDVDKEEEAVPEFGRSWSQSDENDCSMSSWSTEETKSLEDGVSDDNSVSGSSRDDASSKVSRSFSSLSFIQRLMSRSGKLSGVPKAVERRRNGWLRRLGLRSGILDHGGDEASTSSSESEQNRGGRYERVKVRSYRKRSKELSAVYQGQVIKGHDGAILAMKFSPDGQFLATGGEDGVVRVWGVAQSEDCKIPMDDPSCVYLKAHRQSGLGPVDADNEKKCKVKGVKQSADSACVVIPTVVFQISKQPLHEFRGHSGDVLSLSWSNNKHLLSASTDKSVRLWEIGSANCITVFPHSNFVTCVQLNPTNENQFISGSIDGKIRVWDIPRCSVIDWVDIRDIITAVCYRPDGKGAVVGTITGNCRFYDASDNLLRFETQVALSGKKKSSLKRITAFEFSPSNPSKLMVTSADSKVKILEGTTVTQNYSGLRTGSCQSLATFTPDGQHIVCASEDSNIYVWNHENQDEASLKHAKTIWSSERFYSNNAAIAIPWNGPKPRNPVSLASQILSPQGDNLWCMSKAVKCSSSQSEDSAINSFVSRFAPGIFNLNQEFSSESTCRSSATWPEEILPSRSIRAILDESQYKFLRNCFQSTPNSWGQVIVTAGWDGKIRSFQNYGLPAHQ